jgi:hypothetical protein
MVAYGTQLLTQNPSASDISTATGESVWTRLGAFGNAALISGDVLFSYFTAQRTEVCNYVTTFTQGTAAAGLTYAAVGVYTVSPAGNLTQVAVSANNTGMWTTTYLQYSQPVTAFQKTAGTAYAVGVLAVGATMPVLAGMSPPGWLVVAATPVMASALTGQAALPAAVAQASLSNATYYALAQATLSPTAAP